MFCSVAVGKLRQAYKSPAIIGLRCVFKRPCVCKTCACGCASAGDGMAERGECALGAGQAGKDAMGMLRSWRPAPGISGARPSSRCPGMLRLREGTAGKRRACGIPAGDWKTQESSRRSQTPAAFWRSARPGLPSQSPGRALFLPQPGKAPA